MTDGPIASFALGTLAVSRGASETAALAIAANTALRSEVAALETYANELEAWGERMKARALAKSG